MLFTWSDRMLVPIVASLMLATCLESASAGQKALLIGAGEYPWLEAKFPAGWTTQRCRGDGGVPVRGVGVSTFRHTYFGG